MDRHALLFGLSTEFREVLGQAVDLSCENGLVRLPARDLDFYEIFCGKGHLSDEMEAASRQR